MNSPKNTLEISLPKKPFSVVKLQNLFEECQSNKSKLLENKKSDIRNDSKLSASAKLLAVAEAKLSDSENKDCENLFINYVYKYYFEVEKADYFFYDVVKEELVHRTQKDFINEVANKISKGAFEKYFMKNSKIYKITSKLDKPRVYEEDKQYFLNECRGFLHKKYKLYAEYSDDIKEGVDMMLDMIKQISCNNQNDVYDAYVKYLAQLCRGMKTEVIIYKKGEQGIGKSTETDFLINYVLGKDICLLSGTEPLTSNFNKCFLGKLFVVFEELPTFGPREWEAVSSKLKTLTTEKTAQFRGLFKDPIEAENILNFVINTNVESLKNSDGRRIIILPLSSCRKGDYEYMNNIRSKCFNLEVGEAFYSYMMSIDITNYYAQKCFPDTENKLLAIANQLDPVEKFIKVNYVLKKRGIQDKTSDFYNEYKGFCTLSNFKPLTNTMFYAKLKNFCNIEKKKIEGIHKFKVPYETLKALSDKNKWICEFDDEDEDEQDDDDDEVVSPLDSGIKTIDYKKRCQELEKELTELKLKLNL
jgi:hypothetical protein